MSSGFEFLVRRNQIQKRNFFSKGHYAILDSSATYRNSFGGIPRHDRIGRHIFRHNTSGADNGVFTDRHIRQDRGA